MPVVSKATLPEFESKKKVQTTKTDSSTPSTTNQMTELSSTDYTLFPVGCQDGKPLQTTLYVEDHPFVMEVDTGAALSLINKSVYKSTPLLNKLPLQSLTVQLRTYTGQSKFKVDHKYTL